MVEVVIRPFSHGDVPDVLAMMRDLAHFEGYFDRFSITEDDIVEYGLGHAPRFGILVAQAKMRLLGIAVHYQIPWTFDLKPVVVLKELYVRHEARDLGVGRALLESLIRYASDVGASSLRWTVLPDNNNAKNFYAALGGVPDREWETWHIRLPIPPI